MACPSRLACGGAYRDRHERGAECGGRGCADRRAAHSRTAKSCGPGAPMLGAKFSRSSKGLPCALLLFEGGTDAELGRNRPREREAVPRLKNRIVRLGNQMLHALRLRSEALMPRSGRSFATRSLQESASCSHALRSCSAGRDLLPIDTKAGFCPNRIDSAKRRRLSHAFDASRPRPGRITRPSNGGRQSSGRPHRAQGVTAPNALSRSRRISKGLCKAARCWRTSERSLGMGSEGRHGRRAAARGGTNGDC